MRAAHEAVTGHKAQERILPAVTDCRFYGRYYDIPSLCYGPTGHESHGFDEYVELGSVKQTTIAIADCILGQNQPIGAPRSRSAFPSKQTLSGSRLL